MMAPDPSSDLRHAPPNLSIGHIQARVYYEDTDAGGIIYHANFLKFAERGRTELLRSLGYAHGEVMARHNILLVVRHLEIEFLSPGKLDDMLDIHTETMALGNTSITMKQSIFRGGKILAEMKVVVVAITPNGRAVRIPPQLRQIFSETVRGI